MAEAFIEAMQDIATDVNMGQLEAAIREADIQAAIRAIGVDTATYTALTEEVRQVYLKSGQLHAKATPSKVRFGFDVNNPRAERWIRSNAATMVEVIGNEQAAVVRETVRDVVERGIAQGSGPRKMALELAGRVDRATGRRVGGKIVLNSQQSQWVTKAAQELRSGNKTMMSNYLSRTQRDKRFDGIVKKAMKAGEGLSEGDINRLTGKYSDNLLKSRAQIIARTETNRAFTEAADESLRQLVDEGHVKRDSVKRVWDATMDMNTRPSHAATNGQKRGIDELFDVSGVAMARPHDVNAPASETVGCRCFLRQEIDYLEEGL